MGQPELDFGPDFAALQAGSGAGGDEVIRLLVLARIVEPTSKPDSLRVVEEAGFDPPAYATAQAASARVREAEVGRGVRPHR
ncbi:hypothetical protein [Amycolatopsis sp. NPDC049159]|uniref:hypothetical protein n=1 Tax=Amycolatopsis sp. NPDC049159 TaxID=3157210 RepID=UPI0033F57990